MAIDDLWYKNAVIYCLDVEKFQDATLSTSARRQPGHHRRNAASTMRRTNGAFAAV